MTSEGFERILGGAKTGADWAWREIYQALSPVVLGYVRGRGAEDPEDLLGQVFMQVVAAIDSFSGSQDAFRAGVLAGRVVLRLLGDLTLEEVAKVLGKSVTAVKALQHRGLASLAKRISREAISP